MPSHPRYAPAFAIQINDHDLPAAVRAAVTRVRYEDGLQGSARVEIELANRDVRLLGQHIRGVGFFPPTGVKLGTAGSGFSPQPAGLFDLDSRLTLATGYAPDPLAELFEGEITGVEAEFQPDQMPALRVVAHDRLNRLARGSYARGFGPIPDFLIAMLLGAENLILTFVDPIVGAESIALAALNLIFGANGTHQRGQSNLQLLKEIADRYDAEFWMEGDYLYVSRLFKQYTPEVSLTWGSSLLSFSPRVTSIGQVAGVAAKFTLGIIPVSLVVVVNWDFDRERLGLLVVPGEAGDVSAMAKTLGGPILTLITRPIGSPVDIVNSALALTHSLRSTINNRLTAEGTAIGDPRIKAGAMVGIDGVGVDFSGDYRVTNAVHTIDGNGYRTHFKVRKEIIP
jgi:hypothetical protein